MPPLVQQLRAFVLERHPFALPIVQRVLDELPAFDREAGPAAIEEMALRFRRALGDELSSQSATDIPETTPGVTADARLKAARQELLDDCDGFFARAAIAASLTDGERREVLRGMVTGPRILSTELGELGTALPAPGDGVVDVLLRPDDIVHDDASPWRAEVAAKSFRGADCLYTLKLASGTRVLSLVPSHHDHAIGEQIGIRLAIDHVVAFPAV